MTNIGQMVIEIELLGERQTIVIHGARLQATMRGNGEAIVIRDPLGLDGGKITIECNRYPAVIVSRIESVKAE